MQFPDTSSLDTFQKEWPVIKAAPWSFAICVFIVVAVIATVIWLIFKHRIERYKEAVEHLQRDIDRIQRDSTSSLPLNVSLSDTGKAAIDNSGNSSATGGNATAKFGDIHFHAGSPATQEPEDTRPTKEEYRVPTLTFLGARALPIHFGIGGAFSVYECAAGQHPDAIALVACFRNEDNQGSTAYEVKAYLRFMNANKTEIGTGVSGPYWLARSSELLNFPPDESGCVLILLKIGNKFSTPWAERIVFRRRRGIMPREFSFVDLPHLVEIRLRDAGKRLLLPEPIVLTFNASAEELEIKQL